MRSSKPNPYASARFLRSCAQLEQLPDDHLPELAFAGRSNAGKSTALNRLCGHNALARVSKTPGRTQLINLFDVPGGRFADLPGYGFAKVSKDQRSSWGELIGRYFEARTNLCGIVLIMDVRHPLTTFDQQMIDWAVGHGVACHLLLTKADKLGYGAAKNTLLAVRKAAPQLSNITAQLFSAQTDAGIDEFRDRVAALLAAHGASEPA
ncbi:MAG: ribosome biogenesis GTP-binding protein YihA/YsxC [Sinimarinibacterium sp.]|jgi:GTP-binding protein